MNLNELRDRAYKTACEHGWHEEEYSNEHYLCLVISELMEALEADRKRMNAFRNPFEDFISRFTKDPEHAYKVAFDEYIKDTVEDELADAVIRLLDWHGVYGIQLDGSCLEYEVIEEYSRIYKDKTFTESVFNIVASVISFEIQVAFLKIFGLAMHLGIDIHWHIKQKMRYNELRSYKQGNKKY